MATLQDYLKPGQVNLGTQFTPQRAKRPKGILLKTLLQIGVPTGTAILGGLVGGPAGALGGGALGATGLNLFGGGREGETPMGAAGKDLLYGLAGLGVGRVAGPVVGKLLGRGGAKVAGEAVEGAPNIASRLGGEIRESVVRPEIAKGGFYEPRLQEVKRLMKLEGVKGSARAQSRQIGKETLPRLNKQVENLIEQNNVRIKPTDVKKAFLEEINSPNRMHRGEPGFQTNTDFTLKEINKLRNLKSVLVWNPGSPRCI